MFTQKQAYIIIVLQLAACLLLGLGRIATLPPFDGSDETEHYSRIEASAFAKADAPQAYLSSDVVNYFANGPMSRNWILTQAFNQAYNDAVRTKKKGHLKDYIKKQGYTDYQGFFDDASRVKKYTESYAEKSAPVTYTPTTDGNKQFQHPPLYYQLLGHVLRLMPDSSLFTRLLVLRIISFLFAFIGLATGIYATLKHLEFRQHPAAREITVFAALYPFAMPVFFESCARLGNDSLCLLLFSITWSLVLWHLRKPDDKFIWLMTGIVAGYSWLAKAYMIPVTGGLFLFMLLAGWKKEKKLTAKFAPPVVAGLAATLAGIGPYISILQGKLQGSVELNAWMHGKGFLDGGLPFAKIFGNLQAMLITTAYTVPVPVLTDVMLFLLFLVFIRWLLSLPCDPKKEEWVSFFCLAPLCAGLTLHAILSAIAYQATGTTPGYYVHAVAPALALAFGAGLQGWVGRPSGKLLAGFLFAGAIAVNAATRFMKLGVYAGCIGVSDKQEFVINWNAAACRPDAFISHLGVVAWPYLGISCLLLALFLAVPAALLVFKWGNWPLPKKSRL